MANKTKNQKTLTDNLTTAAAHMGIVLMTAATALTVVELPHEERRAVVPSTQPAFAFAGPAEHAGPQSHEIRREKEEIHPHQLAHSISQRTAARAGRA